MKRTFIILLTLILVCSLFPTGARAAGATTYVGYPVELDDYENIEITYVGEEIDEEQSTARLTTIFTNLSDSTITRRASIKVNDRFTRQEGKTCVIVNGVKADEAGLNNGITDFDVEIAPGGTAVVTALYESDSSFRDARIIKFSLEPYMGWNVKLFDISVKLCKYDVPLVERIWPGAYDFDGQTVTTKYYDFTVNELTGAFIIQKDTYRNLRYGDDAESETDDWGDTQANERYVIDHAEELIDKGMEVVFEDGFCNPYSTLKNMVGDDVGYLYGNARSIYYYALALELEREGKYYTYYSWDSDEPGDVKYVMLDNLYDLDNCLTIDTIRRIDRDCYFHGNKPTPSLYGKTVAVNYYETEGSTDLYIMSFSYNHEKDRDEYIPEKKSEWSLLRIQRNEGWEGDYYRGQKIVYVNSDIDGNKIDITESEILDFVNMMNIDLYLRVLIYDIKDEDLVTEKYEFFDQELTYVNLELSKNYLAGYYTEDMRQAAELYVQDNVRLERYKDDLDYYKNALAEGFPPDNTWEEPEIWQAGMEEEIARYQSKIDNFISQARLFDNEEVAAKTRVPTLAHCVDYCSYQDGRYVVDCNDNSFRDGWGDIAEALDTEGAKAIHDANTQAVRAALEPIQANVDAILAPYAEPEQASDESETHPETQPEQKPETSPAEEPEDEPEDEPETDNEITDTAVIQPAAEKSGLTGKDRAVLGTVTGAVVILAGIMVYIIFQGKKGGKIDEK